MNGAAEHQVATAGFGAMEVARSEPDIPAAPGLFAAVTHDEQDILTKTRKSRRTLALPKRCVDALREQREQQAAEREAAGPRWQEHGLVFASMTGTPLDPSHVRRAFRTAIKDAPGIDPAEWTPRELRHSFVSLLPDNGILQEEISRLVGHSSTAVTELVYRKQIRPVL